jgi:hypothetical protein
MKPKFSKDAPEGRDRKRDKDGVKANLRKARKAKDARRFAESGADK